jgi:hypothetical protein
MQRLNRSYRRSKISERKFRQLLRRFALDLTASDAAQLTGLSRRSVTTIFLKIRERIAEECERASPFSSCEVEVDESYFGARRVRGQRGRGASGKTIVFGIFKRNGCVYTEVVPDCKKATLQAIIRGRVSLGAVINSDGWRGIDITSPSLAKFPIFAQVGVPEVWRFDGNRFVIYELTGERYQERDSNPVFPTVTATDLTTFIKDNETMARPEWIRKLRRWAQDRK